MLYGKAGLAWADGKTRATPNGGVDLPGSGESGVEWGWTVGGGVERTVTPRWTVKAEYGFISFGDESFAAPVSRFQTNPPTPVLVSAPSARSDVSTDIHLFEIGMNYKLGPVSVQQTGWGVGSDLQPSAGTVAVAGVRYVHGWGQCHKDLGLARHGLAALASRLTYDDSGINGWGGLCAGRYLVRPHDQGRRRHRLGARAPER
ncbi:MAG: outer membrane protein [Actinomycetota bacterium]